jgi:Mg-chelatase subunit ChlD
MLDEDSFDASLAADADATLSLLTEMTHATDERLREAARRLAARIVLDLARRGTPQRRGVGQLRASTADRGGDLDVEASLETVLEGKAARRPPRAEDLVARDWSRPELALCLLVDRSGSMGGERLAAAALTAAACAYRAPGDFAVVAFAREVDVLRPMGSPQPASAVVEAVLRLRGHGTTGIAGALRAATEQLARTRAARRVVVLLSDCRQTDEIDPRPLARRLPELVVLAPADDAEQAEAFARDSGARFAPLSGAADAPAALARVLDA